MPVPASHRPSWSTLPGVSVRVPITVDVPGSQAAAAPPGRIRASLPVAASQMWRPPTAMVLASRNRPSGEYATDEVTCRAFSSGGTSGSPTVS